MAADADVPMDFPDATLVLPPGITAPRTFLRWTKEVSARTATVEITVSAAFAG
jgi:hypothetical protein